MSEVTIGSRVRISYPIPGVPTGATYTIIDKDAVSWFVMPNIKDSTIITRVPFNCVRPHNMPANYRD